MSKSTGERHALEPELTEKLKQQSERLVESVRAGDYSRAMALISELAEVRDQGLYHEVG
ncbi:MAG: chemotaxis protein CheZ, partial [Pseudomonadales bacterium]